MVLWSRFAGGAAAARFHRPAGNHPPSVSQFQHDAVGRLGRFIATVPFWKMAPEPGAVRKLPEGAGANVLAEPSRHYVVQLIGGAAGEALQEGVPAGAWTVRWIDPAAGGELARSVVAVDAAVLKLELPAGPSHRILHLEKVSQ